MFLIEGDTADDAWRAAAALFREGGPAELQPGRGGDAYEVLHAMLRIDNGRHRWVASRTPALNPAFALVEVLWIAAGRRDAGLPRFWNPRLPAYCGNYTELRGAYGYRLRKHFGIDQLERVYRALDSSPDSRQAVLQIWDSAEDLPAIDGTPRREDIPCNVLAMPKIRHGKLEWLQVMRSNDLFRGLPYNLVQFTAIQEMLAGWLQVETGAYHHVSDSLHVYVDDLATLRVSLAPPGEVPSQIGAGLSLALPRAEWDVVIESAIHRLTAMTVPKLHPNELHVLAFADDLPPAYEAAVRVAAADAARRRGWRDLAEECGMLCGDPALLDAWRRWYARVREVKQHHPPAHESVSEQHTR